MRIHREGRTTLYILAAFILLVNYLALRFIAINLISIVLAALSMGLYFFVMYFFRMVERPHITDDSLVIAPCDGKIVVIEEVSETEVLNEKRKLVSFFMSPLNVHINWFPISGKILKAEILRGSHLVAWAPKSSTLNERSTVLIEAPNGQKILTRQIAGAVARRVVCYAREGKFAEQNQHMGFIKFGSRVDIYLPLDAEIKVEINQVAVGTQTVIAKLKQND